MNLQNMFLMLVTLFFLGCSQKFEKSIDGIIIEKRNERIDGTEYTKDNKIYKGGIEYIYEYSLTKNNEDYYFKSLNDFENLRESWKLVGFDKPDSITITHIKMIVLNNQGNLFKRNSYKESVIEYQYLTSHGIPYYKELTKIGEQTGLIENKKNIWLHPPRGYLFEITELNPWPYIKFPIRKNKTWNWQLEIGDKWGDERWKTWKGNIINNYSYEIVSDEKIATDFGNITCTKIIAKANSRIGETKAVFYFNAEYGGFVSMKYFNIDGSELLMKLVSVTR